MVAVTTVGTKLTNTFTEVANNLHWHLSVGSPAYGPAFSLRAVTPAPRYSNGWLARVFQPTLIYDLDELFVINRLSWGLTKRPIISSRR
jgi:hypothetical protein